jgi:hypothetical protein
MLTQLGLLEAEQLPLVGSQQAEAIRNQDYPRNELIDL